MERIKIGSWTLTSRGEKVFLVLFTIGLFAAAGFVGWLETL